MVVVSADGLSSCFCMPGHVKQKWRDCDTDMYMTATEKRCEEENAQYKHMYVVDEIHVQGEAQVACLP